MKAYIALCCAATALALPTAISAQQAPATPKPAVAVIENIGLVRSEAARYDAARDEYIVSNLGPAGQRNAGFISRIAPDGRVIDLQWIGGGKNGVTLDQPLGVFLKNGQLYVVETTALRSFDLATGAPRLNVPIADAVRLNDLVVADDGTVYITDSGNDDNAGALYKVDPSGKASAFVPRNPALERPNGIALTADGNIVHGGRGVNLVYRDKQGNILREQTLPTGQFDGIVLDADGSLLVASQLGKNVYRVPANNGPVTVVAENIPVPAAIGHDTRRNRLLVPQILLQSLSIFELGS